MQDPTKKMLFVGEQWFGSDARGMCMALRRLGWMVGEVDPMRYLPQSANFSAKVAAKLFRPIFRQSLNTAILREAQKLKPDVVFIYKGPGVYANTVATARKLGFLTAMYYPDVSLYTHGSEIPACIPHYDIIFTSKSWGVKDLTDLNAKDVHVVLHGFDTDTLVGLKDQPTADAYDCDASFIGTWSPWKESLLSAVAAELPDINLQIYGSLWDRATSKHIQRAIQYKTVEGHAYISKMRRSKINIAILSENRHGATQGDVTTSRTFNIPASGAFMLHQRTDEVLTCYREGTEIACFSNAEELVAKIVYYLKHDTERIAITNAGKLRALSEHTTSHRAAMITQQLKQKLISHPVSLPSNNPLTVLQ